MKKIYKAINPKYDSKFEEDFAELWTSYSSLPIVHHHIVVLSRAWEIDFAFIKPKIAIELQGAGPGHTSYLGMKRDYTKHNDLILAGWTMLYFMSADIKTSYILTTIKKILESKNVRSDNPVSEANGYIQKSDPITLAARRLQDKKSNKG